MKTNSVAKGAVRGANDAYEFRRSIGAGEIKRCASSLEIVRTAHFSQCGKYTFRPVAASGQHCRAAALEAVKRAAARPFSTTCSLRLASSWNTMNAGGSARLST